MALIGHGCADRGERIATDIVDLAHWGSTRLGIASSRVSNPVGGPAVTRCDSDGDHGEGAS